MWLIPDALLLTRRWLKQLHAMVSQLQNKKNTHPDCRKYSCQALLRQMNTNTKRTELWGYGATLSQIHCHFIWCKTPIELTCSLFGFPVLIGDTSMTYLYALVDRQFCHSYSYRTLWTQRSKNDCLLKDFNKLLGLIQNAPVNYSESVNYYNSSYSRPKMNGSHFNHVFNHDIHH